MDRFCLAQTHGDQVNLFEVYQSFSAVLETPISEEPCNKRKSQKSPKKTVEKMDRALLQYPSICSHTYTHTHTHVHAHTHTCMHLPLFFANRWWRTLLFVKSKLILLDNGTRARFCKAASELQMVGLFHMPSKKRPDFVQLAIWEILEINEVIQFQTEIHWC